MALPRPKKLKEKASPQSMDAYLTGNSIEYSVSNLSQLTLNELKDQYIAIDNQSQLFKGLILLEARERFSSNKKFGEWIKSIQALCLDNQPTLTRYMNFAKYFKDRDRTGITLTVAYEISAPINADVADKVYQVALNKNLSVAQIKAEIAKAKGVVLDSKDEGNDEVELIPLADISEVMKRIMDDISNLPKHEAIRVLTMCLKKIKS